MSRFRTYLEKTFHLTPHESEEVMSALVKPLKKSIRINTQKICREDFMMHASEQGWVLTETDIPEVFMIDREDTSVALGRTLEHAAGWFYIQELAAAHPPYLLREQVLKNEEGGMNKINTIIDMCASPGGKTTQLADYFSESLIIANEVNRSRTPQLFDNLDRMGYDNVAVVSCDGRFFQNFPEYFDAVLLDAPCSGEGTAFRDSSVIEHWHEKNIHRIAKLQKQLFETAMTIVKPGGFISYSTCTLNKEENEHVLALDDEKQNLQRLFLKRFWPHIEHTGGFFASIFQKKFQNPTSQNYPVLPSQGQTLFVRPVTKGERETVERFISKHLKTKLANTHLFISKDGIFANRHNLGPLMQYFFFVHAGSCIGTLKGNVFTPTQHLWWHLSDASILPSIILSTDEWGAMQDKKNLARTEEDGWYTIRYGRGIVGLGQVRKNEILTNI